MTSPRFPPDVATVLTTTPMILLLNDTLNFAGTERYIADLESGVRQSGTRAAVACVAMSALADRVIDSGGTVRTIGDRRYGLARAWWTVMRALRRGDADVLHAHNGRTALLAVLARMAAGRGQVVLTQHFIRPAHVERRGVVARLSGIAHGFVNSRIDAVIAISDAVRDAMLERGDVRPERVTRVHNGTRVGQASSNGDAQHVRSKLRVPGAMPLIVCAARLDPEKRVGTLIDALAEVRGRGVDFRCAIAGEGRERATLEARVDALGLQEQVALLGFRNDVPALMAAANVFVLPADAEPFGLVVLEAMAAGVPVIATDAGGPREIVVPGETGWLVRPNDPEALAVAIEEALSDPERARRFGRAGRARLEAHFSAERMARETIAVYERVLAQRPAR